MTKDKTVTMSRDLAERVQSALLSSHCPEQFLLNELQRAIAAPIVEADGMGEAVLLGKGFTTLESCEGKYRIITAYQDRDDAWSDYKALCKAQQPAPAAFPGYPPVPEDRKIPESPPAPEVEEPITLEAVGITREGDDGIYIEWTLEGGLAALETAGLVLFASPEGNDMCAEDGSCEVYLAPVDLDATEQRGYLRGLNQASIGTCDVPPPGWVCSRGKGHEGPCAASQAPVQQKKENFTYSSNQATNCAGCSNHKHTPLRVDAMGGYVCLTCIYNELDRLLIEESARHAEPDWQGCQEISDLPRVHEVLQAFSADPTEDNGIAVVQAIVKATTRPVQE